jgi:hypothetical protein
MLTLIAILVVLVLVVGLIGLIGWMSEGPFEMTMFGPAAMGLVKVIAHLVVLIISSLTES